MHPRPAGDDGVLEDSEITAQVIKDGWFHTGDLGRWDEHGYLHLVDRLKDMIITGQLSDNVYSSLLEEVLTRHPGIKMAAVVGLPDDAYGESVHAICVADPQIPVDTAELRRTAVSELGSLYEPRTITFADSLPWTLAGKIDKKALRLMLQGDRQDGPADRPSAAITGLVTRGSDHARGSETDGLRRCAGRIPGPVPVPRS